MKSLVLALAIVIALANFSSGQAQTKKSPGRLSTIVLNAVSGGPGATAAGGAATSADAEEEGSAGGDGARAVHAS